MDNATTVKPTRQLVGVWRLKALRTGCPADQAMADGLARASAPLSVDELLAVADAAGASKC